VAVSQGNTYVVIYDRDGFACTTLDTGWNHTCHYKLWTMDNQSCTYDEAHTTMLATDNVQNALEYHIQDSRYSISYRSQGVTRAPDWRPPNTKGVTIASNCKTYSINGQTLVPVNYEPRQSQQIADYAAFGIAFAATVCLFVGVRRLLSMLHSAVLARKG